MRGLATAILSVIGALTLTASAQQEASTAQIYITTQPEGAVITCDGVTGSTTPLTLADVKPGTHLIVARKPGYHDERRTVTLVAGQRVALDIKLERVTGLLLVHSQPDGCSVRINGADRGRAPLLVTDIAPGKHRLRVTSPGFLPKEVDVTITDRTPVKTTVALTSDSASVTLNSTPPGAKVLLNGIDRGTTPCTLDRIPAGEATLELAFAGYRPYKRAIRLVPGQAETVTAKLTPIPAELTVVSIPAGARVYIENQFRGETPFTLTDVKPGTYRVRAEMVAHAVLARNVTLTRAQKLTEEFRLERNAGMLELITEPAGVQVFVDGKPHGKTVASEEGTDKVSAPLIVDLLTIGAHEIQLTRSGYYGKTVPFTMEKNATVTLHEKLKRRFIPNYEVHTADEIERGVLQEILPTGDVRLETRPGIFKTIPAKDIKTMKPLRVNPAEKDE